MVGSGLFNGYVLTTLPDGTNAPGDFVGGAGGSPGFLLGKAKVRFCRNLVYCGLVLGLLSGIAWSFATCSWRVQVYLELELSLLSAWWFSWWCLVCAVGYYLR